MAHPVDAVTVALLSVIGSAPDANGVRAGSGAFADVRVFDGPPLAFLDEGDALGIGTAVTDVPTAQGETRRGYGDRRVETFDLGCVAQSWSGDTDLTTLRARVFALRDALGAVILADHTIGSACEFARLSRYSYRALQNEQGALALLEFFVRVNATRFEGSPLPVVGYGVGGYGL